ncbi:thiamine phosphate synthase [Sulfurimonas lithotrophica]|uniref:Thiamine phosphate synthase n=1 Tax=Sulfurimonas lithotrophica TaxID=2590022 RepID=A0A5P8P124_9BACT|nr:thiamine phosphate synthase [Sulfurimonas lithotrophica]QFR49364.1 thiamine phosphate synthase [Sulfurimonas lithotrophica]
MQLYALCDQELLDLYNISLEEFVKIASTNDAKVIQYRNKTSDIAFIKQQLIQIRKLYDGFLIVNDKYELVEFCDGVHLGQEDLKEIDPDAAKAVKILRSVIKKDKLLGISTHNEKEVVEANGLDLNYIGLGAYRDTSTKKDISAVLGDKIENIASKSIHPVAVIGGVKLEDKFENISYKVIGSGLLG